MLLATKKLMFKTFIKNIIDAEGPRCKKCDSLIHPDLEKVAIRHQERYCNCHKFQQFDEKVKKNLE